MIFKKFYLCFYQKWYLNIICYQTIGCYNANVDMLFYTFNIGTQYPFFWQQTIEEDIIEKNYNRFILL